MSHYSVATESLFYGTDMMRVVVELRVEGHAAQQKEHAVVPKQHAIWRGIDWGRMSGGLVHFTRQALKVASLQRLEYFVLTHCLRNRFHAPFVH